MLNCINVCGRLVRDPELTKTKSGMEIASFSLANNGPKDAEGKDTSYFFDVKVFGKPAGTIMKYCSKGSLVTVTGRLTYRDYQTKEGKDRRAIEILADHVDFIDNPKKDQPAGEPKAENVKTCPNCGAKTTTAFCPACGSKVA